MSSKELPWFPSLFENTIFLLVFFSQRLLSFVLDTRIAAQGSVDNSNYSEENTVETGLIFYFNSFITLGRRRSTYNIRQLCRNTEKHWRFLKFILS